jgi:hypothetical protein
MKLNTTNRHAGRVSPLLHFSVLVTQTSHFPVFLTPHGKPHHIYVFVPHRGQLMAAHPVQISKLSHVSWSPVPWNETYCSKKIPTLILYAIFSILLVNHNLFVWTSKVFVSVQI